CLEAVRRYPGLRGVFHCYSGSAEMAEVLLSLGWYLGFDGPVTSKNARKAQEVLQICPLERILVETDSPYLPPVPMRGKRNDPGNLPWICAKIAEVKGLSMEEVARITSENGSRLFGGL
ncbi:MAG: TatD family hydrolase, partial [Oscillospiraceae bacterium]|nr:TatD family hydrolase [Oscillospiraceae bacterium]